MMIVLALVFGALVLAAAVFAVYPLLKRSSDGGKAAPWRGAALFLVITVIGVGSYLLLGQPNLALQALQGPDRSDYRSLIAELAVRIRERPDDIQGWILLGNGYLTLGNGQQAAMAFRRAVALAEARPEGPSADLLTSYGEALAVANGTVTEEAEAAFRAALARDPDNPNARFYMGLAHALRAEDAEALSYWSGLLADAPPDAPWREFLFGQLAALGAAPVQGGGAEANAAQMPDIGQMVQGLAERLAANPDDLDGWLRLIRSYAVLGETENAADALARARSHFSGNAEAMAALDAEARANALE